MRLVIISNMAHYRRADGVIVGHGATARELDALATLFDDVRHVACLHAEPPPASARPYAARNFTLVPVPPAGGDTVGAKLDILRQMPGYVRTMLRELRDADAVHVRCPANITLAAIPLLAALPRPRRRWIKYAGSWLGGANEPASYRLQRQWLARPFHRAQVTINGGGAVAPPHVHAMLNPCLTRAELARGREAAAGKTLTAPVRLLFVGHLGAAKNPGAAIDALVELRAGGVDARLDVVGEGADLEAMRASAPAHVRLHGPLPREQLDALYAAAHFVVLPSRTEGWPKVLSEGMASGALPIATAVGSIPEILGDLGVGRVIPALATPPAIADAVHGYLTDPDAYRREVTAAVAAAEAFTYDAYLATVRRLLEL